MIITDHYKFHHSSRLTAQSAVLQIIFSLRSWFEVFKKMPAKNGLKQIARRDLAAQSNC